jgi:hypothetical protein
MGRYFVAILLILIAFFFIAWVLRYLGAHASLAHAPYDRGSASAGSSYGADAARAIRIADAELVRHFPEGKQFGITYQPVAVVPQAAPDYAPDRVYLVTYILPNGPADQTIWIEVDTTTGGVLRIQQASARRGTIQPRW